MARFRDAITIAEIATGLTATIDNMEGLVAAARTLIEAGSFAPAFGLSIMSLEESGKLTALRAMCQRGGISGTKWGKLWASFRSHSYKSSGGLMNCCPDKLRGDPEIMMSLAFEHAATAEQIEDSRQWSFYVDFEGETRTWNRPQDFSEQEARQALSLAEAALRRVKSHQQAGLHSFEALEVMREVYEPLFRELLASDDSGSAKEVALRALPYHQEYFRRISDEGILDPLSEVELLV